MVNRIQLYLSIICDWLRYPVLCIFNQIGCQKPVVHFFWICLVDRILLNLIGWQSPIVHFFWIWWLREPVIHFFWSDWSTDPSCTYLLNLIGWQKPCVHFFWSDWLTEPSKAPVIRVASTTSNSINIEWEELPPEERRGVITSHLIEYRRGSDAQTFTRNVSGTARSYLISGKPLRSPQV